MLLLSTPIIPNTGFNSLFTLELTVVLPAVETPQKLRLPAVALVSSDAVILAFLSVRLNALPRSNGQPIGPRHEIRRGRGDLQQQMMTDWRKRPQPRCRYDAKRPLEAGMALSLETPLRLPGAFSCSVSFPTLRSRCTRL
jgi:hypothetical protein